MTPNLNNLIKAPKSKIFRRLLVKRRLSDTGEFESDWQDLTRYVKRWGSFGSSLDTPRYGDLKFDNAAISVLNIDGNFNPNDNLDSFWFGYADMQRSLVRIQAGFLHQTLGANGIWTNTELPTDNTIWQGIISGDIYASSFAELTLPLKPLSQIFRDYPANQLTGYTTTGLTAGAFFNSLLNHQVGGKYVFKPFIGDGTSSSWLINSPGTIDYGQGGLNTSTSEDIYDLDTWGVITRIAQCENSLAGIDRQGSLVFKSKTATASVVYGFVGINTDMSSYREYGLTIKSLSNYGKRLTSYYSRVAVKFRREDTGTSFVNTSTVFLIDGSNTAYNLGQRTYSIDNFFLGSSVNAAAVAASVLPEVSRLNEQVEFTTSFIPHLNLLDRVSLTYDSTDMVQRRSLWDLNNWAETVSVDPDDLIWDSGRGDNIILESTEFKILSININLDTLETSFVARKI